MATKPSKGLPEPYYDEDGITIYHGDCREIAPDICFSVVVTDPPYGVAYSSSRGGVHSGASIGGDNSTELREWMLTYWRGPALVFGHWRIAPPARTRAVLVWDKGPHVGMGDLSIPWKPNHEFIYVLGEGFSGHRGSGVLSINAPSPNFSDQLHQTEKPVPLMQHLISKCPPGIVLDPFMGSGTTLVAAKNLGRKAIGIEIEERYCEIAVKRLAQRNLFGGAA